MSVANAITLIITLFWMANLNL